VGAKNKNKARFTFEKTQQLNICPPSKKLFHPKNELGYL
jgi:hypothetical protein